MFWKAVFLKAGLDRMENIGICVKYGYILVYLFIIINENVFKFKDILEKEINIK